METNALVENLKNALRAEAAQTAGLEDVTKALTYTIGVVIKNGRIVGYTVDKTEDFTYEDEQT